MDEFRHRPEQMERSRIRARAAYARPEGKAKARASGKLWDANNRDKVRDIKRKYKQSDKGRAADARYKAGEAYRAARHRKDALRRWRRYNNGSMLVDAGIHWTKVAERQGSMACSVCGRICIPRGADKGLWPTVDHIVPLVAGGTHTWANVRLLCMRCNSAKTAQDIKHSNPTLHALVLQRMDEMRTQAEAQGRAQLSQGM